MSDDPNKATHKATARTFRLGAEADQHIAEIAAHLSVVLGAPATDTAAVRYALAEAVRGLRENAPRKNPKKTAK